MGPRCSCPCRRWSPDCWDRSCPAAPAQWGPGHPVPAASVHHHGLVEIGVDALEVFHHRPGSIHRHAREALVVNEVEPAPAEHDRHVTALGHGQLLLGRGGRERAAPDCRCPVPSLLAPVHGATIDEERHGCGQGLWRCLGGGLRQRRRFPNECGPSPRQRRQRLDLPIRGLVTRPSAMEQPQVESRVGGSERANRRSAHGVGRRILRPAAGAVTRQDPLRLLHLPARLLHRFHSGRRRRCVVRRRSVSRWLPLCPARTPGPGTLARPRRRSFGPPKACALCVPGLAKLPEVFSILRIWIPKVE
jgi:hypothetical protein